MVIFKVLGYRYRCRRLVRLCWILLSRLEEDLTPRGGFTLRAECKCIGYIRRTEDFIFQVDTSPH